MNSWLDGVRASCRRWLAWVLAGVCTATAAQAAGNEVACPPLPSVPTAEQFEQARPSARDHGFLWRISRDGHHSYLYGTVHVGRPEWLLPGPRLAEALRDTDTLAVEVDLTDPSMLAEALTAGPARDALALPPALADRLARLRRSVCLPDETAVALHPLLQAMTVMLQEARRSGLHGEFAQELMLSATARALGRDIVSLESAARQMAALIPADPVQAGALVEATVAQLESGDGPRVLRRMAEVWDQGRLVELENYLAWCECARTEVERASMRQLLDARNPALAERIDALHRAGKRVLAAVGALHMVGDAGLPRLLMRRGYTVQRIAFAPM